MELEFESEIVVFIKGSKLLERQMMEYMWPKHKNRPTSSCQCLPMDKFGYLVITSKNAGS
jgi:hypothetical protein